MDLATTRAERTLRQFKKKALAISAVAAALGILAAGLLDPVNTREGAITLAVSGSVLASLLMAAIALEREDAATYLRGLGLDQVFQDRLHDIPNDLWSELLAGVHHHFYVLGMANHGYLTSEEDKVATRDALKKALGRKDVRVTILWLDPTSEIAIMREDEEGKRGLRSDTCESILWFWEAAKDLVPEERGRLSLREHHSLPTCGITWADDQVIVTHYLAGKLNQRAPGIVLDAAPPLLERVGAMVQRRAPKSPALARNYIRNYREVASDAWSREIIESRLPIIEAKYEELRNQPNKASEAVLRREDTASANDDDEDRSI